MLDSIYKFYVLDAYRALVEEERPQEAIDGCRKVATLWYGPEGKRRRSLIVLKPSVRSEAQPFSEFRGGFFVVNNQMYCSISQLLREVYSPSVDLGFLLAYPDRIEHHHPFVSRAILDATKISNPDIFFEFANILKNNVLRIPDSFESNLWTQEYDRYFQILDLIRSEFDPDGAPITFDRMYYEQDMIRRDFHLAVSRLEEIISRVESLPKEHYNVLYRSVVYADQSEPLFFGR